MSNPLPSEQTRQKQMRAHALRSAILRAAHGVADARAANRPATERYHVDSLIAAVLAYRNRNSQP